MQVELERAKDLFIWPIPATLIDIQPYYAGWYNWARTQCRVQDLTHDETTQQHHQTPSCPCHPPSPYKINELWSLQKAFWYGCKLFIDKSCTLSNWTSSLSSSRSSLSHEDQVKMVNYATHDAMAVTFLIRLITEKWTFKKIEERKMGEMFIAFNSIKLPPLRTPTSSKKKIKNINVQKLSKIFKCTDSDIESISSDDEIYLNQLNEPVMNDYHLEDQIKNDNVIQDAIQNLDDEHVELEIELPTADIIMDENNDDGVESVGHHIVVANEVDNPPDQQQQRHRKRRSDQARKKKNQKRNNQLRFTRYKYYLTRPYYYKFKSRIIRKVLRHHGVQFRHIKKVQDRVVIGAKTDQARRDYERTLPYNCFNKNNYERFTR